MYISFIFITWRRSRSFWPGQSSVYAYIVYNQASCVSIKCPLYKMLFFFFLLNSASSMRIFLNNRECWPAEGIYKCFLYNILKEWERERARRSLCNWLLTAAVSTVCLRYIIHIYTSTDARAMWFFGPPAPQHRFGLTCGLLIRQLCRDTIPLSPQNLITITCGKCARTYIDIRNISIFLLFGDSTNF